MLAECCLGVRVSTNDIVEIGELRTHFSELTGQVVGKRGVDVVRARLVASRDDRRSTHGCEERGLWSFAEDEKASTDKELVPAAVMGGAVRPDLVHEDASRLKAKPRSSQYHAWSLARRTTRLGVHDLLEKLSAVPQTSLLILQLAQLGSELVLARGDLREGRAEALVLSLRGATQRKR